MEQDGTINKFTKKEALGLRREQEKLEQNIGGIKDMGVPAAIFVVDAHKETIAIKKLSVLASQLLLSLIPMLIRLIDYPIPGNDDSIKHQLFVGTAEACSWTRSSKRPSEKDGKAKVSSAFRDDKGNRVNVEEVISATL